MREKNNISPYIIPLYSMTIKRGKKIIFRIDKSDDEDNVATYIRSSICGVKAIKMTWEEDEYYLFNHSDIGYFMLEKDIIYEKEIKVNEWSGLIGV